MACRQEAHFRVGYKLLNSRRPSTTKSYLAWIESATKRWTFISKFCHHNVHQNWPPKWVSLGKPKDTPTTSEPTWSAPMYNHGLSQPTWDAWVFPSRVKIRPSWLRCENHTHLWSSYVPSLRIRKNEKQLSMSEG